MVKGRDAEWCLQLGLMYRRVGALMTSSAGRLFGKRYVRESYGHAGSSGLVSSSLLERLHQSAILKVAAGRLRAVRRAHPLLVRKWTHGLFKK